MANLRNDNRLGGGAGIINGILNILKIYHPDGAVEKFEWKYDE